MPIRMVIDQHEPEQEPKYTEYPEYVEHARPSVEVPHEKAAQLHGSHVTHLRA